MARRSGSARMDDVRPQGIVLGLGSTSGRTRYRPWFFTVAPPRRKAVRRAIRAGEASVRALAKRYGISLTIVLSVEDEVAEAPPQKACRAAKGELRIWLIHVVDHACEQPCSGLAAAPSGGSLRDGIEHRTTKPAHPRRRLLPAVLAGSGSMAC
jgi:hypothetical protein